jgi:hypothetical protein
MTVAGLVEPEFVVHLFAPLDGPDAAAALAGVRTLWDNCRGQLGMTQPIVEAGLPAELPADPADRPEGALAGLQDPAVQFQAVARRQHDVLNFSFAIAALDAVPRLRPWLGASLPSGWHEFHRWWRTLGGGTAPSGGGTALLGGGTALLGGAVVLLAKSPDAAGVDVRAAVPAEDDDADGWWEAGFRLRDFAAWETTPPGTHHTRRLVLLAGLNQDAELSRFAWSDGGTALPPLGRYLMHAAKLRYLARVLGDGSQLTRLRRRITDRLDDLTGPLREPGDATGPAPGPAADALLAGDRAQVAATLQQLRLLRRSADIARANMVGALGAPLPADASLSEWLAQQVDDDTEFLDAVRERAERLSALLRPPAGGPGTPAPPSAPPADSSARPAEVEHRVGFDVDVVHYSGRSTPQQKDVQRRLAGVVERILAGIDVPLHDTDRQQAGDGMMVVLPASVPADVALPALLHGWRAQATADNAAHPHDRIRLRLSVGAGPFTRSAIGFSGQAIIEIGRLNDSQVLRQAVLDHPDADVVAIVADRLYRDVVGEGYPGLDAGEFEPVEVTLKTYRGQAWLWTGGTPSRPPGTPRTLRHPGDGDTASGAREVLVIHGPGKQPRKDLFELLRALDLRPLGWDAMVQRAGPPAPGHEDVVAAALTAAAGVLVVVTPEDERSRPDVMLRAGHARALRPEHTIVVRIGEPGRPTDLDLRHPVTLTRDTAEERVIFQQQIAQRLRTLGCPVDTSGPDWLDPGRFRGLLVPSPGGATEGSGSDSGGQQ